MKARGRRKPFATLTMVGLVEKVKASTLRDVKTQVAPNVPKRFAWFASDSE